MANEKGLELILNYPHKFRPHIMGDEIRINQILNNLIGNAIKFTDSDHAALNVNQETIDDSNFFTFEVEDTGIGIDESKEQRPLI